MTEMIDRFARIVRSARPSDTPEFTAARLVRSMWPPTPAMLQAMLDREGQDPKIDGVASPYKLYRTACSTAIGEEQGRSQWPD